MITSEQARADALADAETLRRHYYSTSRGRRCLVRDADYLEHAVRYVATTSVPPHVLAAITARAARAAFRAVPGLRGER